MKPITQHEPPPSCRVYETRNKYRTADTIHSNNSVQNHAHTTISEVKTSRNMSNHS